MTLYAVREPSGVLFGVRPNKETALRVAVLIGGYVDDEPYVPLASVAVTVTRDAHGEVPGLLF